VKKDFGIVIDWETTGIRQHETPWRTYLEGPQGIELGAIAVKLPEFEPLGEFSARIRFLGSRNGIAYGGPEHEQLTWSDEAQAVHGISVTELAKALTPVEAAGNFLRFAHSVTGIADFHKHPVMICGHNPASDAYYLRQLLFLGGVERKIRFHARMLDSFTIGYMLLGTKSSTELFKHISGVVRTTHNALQDAQLTLNAFRQLNSVCRECRQSQIQ
jgi:hypothetical protein